MGRKAGTEVGVNSCLVALIATESVSIALSWLLLPPEVGVNRHGLKKAVTSQDVVGADIVLWFLNPGGNHWTLMVHPTLSVQGRHAECHSLCRAKEKEDGVI